MNRNINELINRLRHAQGAFADYGCPLDRLKEVCALSKKLHEEATEALEHGTKIDFVVFDNK